jgi:hypothetical protein
MKKINKFEQNYSQKKGGTLWTGITGTLSPEYEF